MKMKTKYFKLKLLLWIMALPYSSNAFTDIVNVQDLDISNECIVIEDKNDQYKLSDVIDLHGSITNIHNSSNQDFHPDYTYWIYCGIKNLTEKEDWILRLPFQSITHGEVYVLDSLGKYSDHIKIGIFERRGKNDGWLSIGKKYNYSKINFDKDNASQLWIKVKNSKNNLGIKLKVELTPADRNFYENEIWFTTFLSLFAGALLLLIFVALVLYITIHDRSYWKYCLYLMSLVIWMTFANGILRNWCIDTFPFIDPQYVFLLRSFGILTLTFYIQFVWEFGNLSDHFPSMQSWYTILKVFIFSLFIVDWIILLSTDFNFVWSNLVSAIALISTMIFSTFLIINLIKNKDQPFFKILIIGLGIVFLTMLVTFTKVTINGFESINAYEVFFGQALDIVVFTFGIALKFRDHLKVSAENAVIKKLLNEKDTLIQEIHHRVKNNLQVISSLLNIQRNRATDQVAKDALKEGQNRVQSMFLIHQDLYQQENVTSINMKKYLSRITNNLFDTYNISPDKIKLVTDIEEIDLDVDSVVPIGLIINELISNALKYAFPNNKSGTIHVTLVENNGNLILSVSDDGIGITDVSQINKGDSFGFNLINAFAKKLDADIDIHGINGTEVRLNIKKYQKTG